MMALTWSICTSFCAASTLGLWVALAVPRIEGTGKHDLQNGVQSHRFQRLRNAVDTEPRCSRPSPARLAPGHRCAARARTLQRRVKDGVSADRRRSECHSAGGKEHKPYPQIPDHAFLPACDDMCRGRGAQHSIYDSIIGRGLGSLAFLCGDCGCF